MPTTLLKFRIACSIGEEGRAATAVLKWSQTAVVLLEGHMQGVLASKKGLDDFSN